MGRDATTGAINFLVITFSALLAFLAMGNGLRLEVFQAAGAWLLGGIILAIVMALLLRETGPRHQG